MLAFCITFANLETMLKKITKQKITNILHAECRLPFLASSQFNAPCTPHTISCLK